MDKFVNSKEKKEKHTNRSKLKQKQSELVKKIIPKSGSYSLDSHNETADSNMKILNDEIELNSAERIVDNVNTTGTSSFLNNTNELTNFNDKTTSSYNQEATHIVKSFNSESFPRKKTFMGFPLLCFTYFAAIYSLLAYGATSLLSIIELMLNNSPKLFPLYLLLAGYLLITLMSFLLIVAIQREKLNLILFWIISLSVFILPEIGLNIVLAENSFNWFNTTKGLYTLIALVIRVTIDLPCIGIILAYHINRTKRNNFLQKMIKPLRRDIMNGEVLKSYNNLDISPKYPVIDQMPKPISITPAKSESPNVEEISKTIGLNVEEIDTEKSYESENTSEENYENSNLSKISHQASNTYQYKFSPGVNYEILVRPSKNGEFLQKFVNIDNVKVIKNKPVEIPITTKHIPRNQKKPVMIQTEQIKNTKYDIQRQELVKTNEEDMMNKIKANWLNSLSYSKGKKYETIERTIDLYDEQSFNIPINYGTTRSVKEKRRPLFSSINQTLPFTAGKEVRKKYLDIVRSNQVLNVNNHQIYLPTPSSMIGSLYNHTKPKSSALVQNGLQYKSASILKSPECNCVNIAACSKENLDEFLHSDDCVLSKRSFNKINSSTTMYLSNPDLFIQRKHF